MRVFSLFSGIGGFDLAFQNKGHEIVGACEIDQYARSVYARHFPNVRIWEDAREIKESELPDFDVLCAGFPCQPFSKAGKMHGFSDTRGTLFFEIARIAKARRPQCLFLENVKGLLNHAKGITFETILKTLDELGYDAEWCGVNSKWWIPQNRDRIYIIANLRENSIPQIFPVTGKISKDTKRIKRIGRLNIYNTDAQAGKIYSTDGISTCVSGQRVNSQGWYYFPDGKIRRLTPTDCERLQTFPDGYTDSITEFRRYSTVGNAVTVSVIEDIIGLLP